mmetsp:Transcript_2826/g.4410  ORF Transcript_2826/g.4410 Transcript_2826/m.4410 type:complete len:84 (+) Transcript_2826:2911-3162(+)
MGPSISMDNHPPKNYMQGSSFSSKQLGDQFYNHQPIYSSEASRNQAAIGRQKSKPQDQLDSASIQQFYFNSMNQFKPEPRVQG